MLQDSGIEPQLPSSDPESEAAPILGSWRNIYAVVLLLHALLIIFFYLFSRAYA